jgi:hypothetical protein
MQVLFLACELSMFAFTIGGTTYRDRLFTLAIGGRREHALWRCAGHTVIARWVAKHHQIPRSIASKNFFSRDQHETYSATIDILHIWRPDADLISIRTLLLTLYRLSDLTDFFKILARGRRS